MMNCLHELCIQGECGLSLLKNFNPKCTSWSMRTFGPQTFLSLFILSKGRLFSTLGYYPLSEVHPYKWTESNSLLCSFFFLKKLLSSDEFWFNIVDNFDEWTVTQFSKNMIFGRDICIGC